MAFLFTPRFAPAYTAQQCNPWACTPRPQHSYRRAIHPSSLSFAPFFNEVDELINALDQEARREAARREIQRQRQQRQRIVRARFNVHENPEGYQIDAELPHFKQEHIDIEVTDNNTLKLSGNTHKQAEQQSHATEKAVEANAASTGVPQHDDADEVTLNEPAESVSGVVTPTHSDTESHRSYQATVEDDFEDLGAETASTFSAHSENEAPKESKGKEKVPEESLHVDTDPAVQQAQPEAPAQQQTAIEKEELQFHGFFQRTFRFPERIDASTVRASLRNGLLSITIPKAKAPEVRRIQIQ